MAKVGIGSVPSANGELLIGNATSGKPSVATLTAGTGMTINNTAGAIELISSGGGGGGGVIQQVYTEDSTFVAPAATVPLDNTIPQLSETALYSQLSTAITPTNAGNELLLQVVIPYQHNGSIAGQYPVCCIFENGVGTDAIAATIDTDGGGGATGIFTVIHRVSAGSTSARTYDVRLGSTAGNAIRVNGYSGGAIFGGVERSSFTIWEVGTGTFPGGFNWQEDTSSPISLATDTGYIANLGTPIQYDLPAVAAQGDTYQITDLQGGLFTIAQGAGQTVQFGNRGTSAGAGAKVASTSIGDSIEIVCVTANTKFQVLDSVGTFNVTI